MILRVNSLCGEVGRHKEVDHDKPPPPRVMAGAAARKGQQQPSKEGPQMTPTSRALVALTGFLNEHPDLPVHYLTVSVSDDRVYVSVQISQAHGLDDTQCIEAVEAWAKAFNATATSRIATSDLYKNQPAHTYESVEFAGRDLLDGIKTVTVYAHVEPRTVQAVA